MMKAIGAKPEVSRSLPVTLHSPPAIPCVTSCWNELKESIEVFQGFVVVA